MKTAIQFLGKKAATALLLVMSLVTGIMAMAQDATTTTKTTTTTEEWYANPLYIVIGVLAFIILAALLMRGNSRK